MRSLPPELSRILLHIKVPGEPIAQERHRWGSSKYKRGGHNYDPNAKDKESFQWQVKAAVPRLVPVVRIRLGILIEVWSGKAPVQERINRKPTGHFRYVTDWDNYAKFYCDALSGIAWDDDCWIEDGRVILHRSAAEPAVKIMVWELP